jgi:hypothetical protein
MGNEHLEREEVEVTEVWLWLVEGPNFTSALVPEMVEEGYLEYVEDDSSLTITTATFRL